MCNDKQYYHADIDLLDIIWLYWQELRCFWKKQIIMPNPTTTQFLLLETEFELWNASNNSYFALIGRMNSKQLRRNAGSKRIDQVVRLHNTWRCLSHGALFHTATPATRHAWRVVRLQLQSNAKEQPIVQEVRFRSVILWSASLSRLWKALHKRHPQQRSWKPACPD